MSHKFTDASSSLLHPDSSSRGHIPQGPETNSTSSFENEQPDEDCEPRRCIAKYYLMEYFKARESFVVNNNDGDLSETALDTTASNERLRRQRTKDYVTLSHTQSNLDMLECTLDQMLPRAYKRAFNGSAGFLVTAFVSIMGYSSHFPQKFYIVGFMCCVAAGFHGVYCNLYWWAIKRCHKNVQNVQERLENDTLRQDHINYLEGGLWSLLRNSNL
ncbi:uncharacterized protein Bfra_000808 [Botrytis fragariae]|uniref:Uncharacterized protein n=1 Tax=Botrytis fragariae TaxID=1964551 RepID=A0A8H6ENA3_9HELO|nr:uncharacterized protein Bfra_000808 [Botrytis fragariae]KAF5878641.1 hypothetical protein Bfra_000808 [Botrytis fragariae]